MGIIILGNSMKSINFGEPGSLGNALYELPGNKQFFSNRLYKDLKYHFGLGVYEAKEIIDMYNRHFLK